MGGIQDTEFKEPSLSGVCKCAIKLTWHLWGKSIDSINKGLFLEYVLSYWAIHVTLRQYHTVLNTVAL